MGFNRNLLSESGHLPQLSYAGAGLLAHFAVTENAADAVLVVTAAMLGGGFVAQTTTLTADRIFTTDTAANIAAAWPSMEIGDSYSFVVSSGQVGVFDLILAGGVGVTLQGAGNVSPQASRIFVLVKTAAATFDLY